jgi:alkylation response protein AidB-like acyl-CoA dehydrogenase
MAVPVELGGMGATTRQVTWAQAELARHCPSTALASSMHMHITLFAAWRYRREMPGAEGLLKRIVDERLVLVSTGGNDFTRPSGTASKVDGGYKVSGRKVFASQAPVGDALSTLFEFAGPDGRQVLSMSVPMSADGIEMVETWDTLGMRGTGSNGVVLTDVFVPDAAVGATRPWGTLDPPLMAIVGHAMPVISGVYLGVAEAARDRALAKIAGTERAKDPLAQRLAGLLDYKLRVARWALTGALDQIGDDVQPSHGLVAIAMQAKRAIAEEAVSAVDVAMEMVGGASYFRKAGIESAVRDVRGVLFHPLSPEKTLQYAGALALGDPISEM